MLVCNTGGPPAGADPLGFDREQWEAAYRSLVLAPMALVERCVPAMRRRGWGRILNVASTSVCRAAARADALQRAPGCRCSRRFKTVARDVAGDGVTLNTVLPGRIATDRIFSLSGGRSSTPRPAAESTIPARRLGTVEEMAAAAAFLCSDRAGYVTGQALAVDGGLLQSL